MNFTLPNFRGKRALVLHRQDSNSRKLVRQLENLGLTVRLAWPADQVTAEGFDVLFFDADLGYDGLFSWPPERPPIPLIALMGSEAPGRIEWTLGRCPSAYLTKPIGSTGVFSALAIAFHTFETREALKLEVDDLRRRIQARPIVLQALTLVARHFAVDEAAAYRLLRAESMNRRLSVEDLSELLVNNRDAMLSRLEPQMEALRQAN